MESHYWTYYFTMGQNYYPCYSILVTQKKFIIAWTFNFGNPRTESEVFCFDKISVNFERFRHFRYRIQNFDCGLHFQVNEDLIIIKSLLISGWIKQRIIFASLYHHHHPTQTSPSEVNVVTTSKRLEDFVRIFLFSRQPLTGLQDCNCSTYTSWDIGN